jgi:hypothetical protein
MCWVPGDTPSHPKLYYGIGGLSRLESSVWEERLAARLSVIQWSQQLEGWNRSDPMHCEPKS